MRLTLFGTYNTALHPRATVLSEGLSARGHGVLACNVPLRLTTAARVAMLQQAWRLLWLGLELARCWVALAREAWHLPRGDAVIVGYMGHFDVHLARLLFPRTPIVLDHLIGASDTAQDRGEQGRVKLALLSAIDRAALSVSDVVVVDTEEHRQQLPSHVAAKTVVVPVGASASWFQAARARLDQPAARGNPLRVVFFGLYTPLQGAVVIGAALALLRDSRIEVTMIGDGQDRGAAQAASRGGPAITWIDWVPSPDLPVLVAGHDVCLGIFGTTPKARRVVPNKVFQGAAAGCVIVTSDTRPQRDILGDAALYVPPGDSGALAAALRGLADDPAAVAALSCKARDRARERFTPHASVGPLAERLQAIADGRYRRGSTPRNENE
jgi:glycosyltransferase involved in cell wall biosynthesis